MHKWLLQCNRTWRKPIKAEHTTNGNQEKLPEGTFIRAGEPIKHINFLVAFVLKLYLDFK